MKFVERSRGRRVVGDSMRPFREGDLVVVDPDLPHVWINDPAGPQQPGCACALIARFRENFLGTALEHTPEFAAVADLLRRSRQGLLFAGPVARQAADLLLEAAAVCRVSRMMQPYLEMLT